MRRFDVVVAGAGGMGTAAAAHLARRGASVLALDRFPVGHARGSSHGQTRLIRLAYFEHPDYVPLLRRSRKNSPTLPLLPPLRLPLPAAAAPSPFT